MKFIKPTLALFLISFLFVGCKGFSPVEFDELINVSVTVGNGGTNSGGNSGNSNIKGEYYFKATFGTLPIDWEVDDAETKYAKGNSSSLSRGQGLTTGSLTAMISTKNQDFLDLKPSFGVEFLTYRYYYEEDKATIFNAFVKTGSWPVVDDASTVAPGSRAVVFHYTDRNGKEYSSLGGGLPQSATVVSVTPIPASLGQLESQKIKLTFHCYLYPVNKDGSTIEVTNGEATLLLRDLL